MDDSKTSSTDVCQGLPLDKRSNLFGAKSKEIEDTSESSCSSKSSELGSLKSSDLKSSSTAFPLKNPAPDEKNLDDLKDMPNDKVCDSVTISEKCSSINEVSPTGQDNSLSSEGNSEVLKSTSNLEIISKSKDGEEEGVADVFAKNSDKSAHQNNVNGGDEKSTAPSNSSQVLQENLVDYNSPSSKTSGEPSAKKALFMEESKLTTGCEMMCDGQDKNVAQAENKTGEEAHKVMPVDIVSQRSPERRPQQSEEENEAEKSQANAINESTSEAGDDLDTSCELLVFAQKDLNSADRDKEVTPPPLSADEKIERDGSSEKNSVYIQPIFEDITEDEDSDDENYENIELELDDLIDAEEINEDDDESKSKSNSVSVNGEIEEKSAFESSSKMNGKGEVGKDSHLSSEGEENSVKHLGNNSDVSKSENHDPACNMIQNGPDADKKINIKHSSAGVEPVRKKFTARKSGKPVNQLESAPLKRINMHPIKNVTMNLSEVQDALDFDPLKDMKKKLKKSDHTVTGYTSETGQGNTYRVVSVTQSNLNLKKKRMRKNTYDFPGCKKRKKGKFLDDVASSGASSIDSVSLSDGDLGDLEVKESNAPLSETGSSNGTVDPSLAKDSCSSSSATALPSSMLSPSSSPTSSSTSSQSNRALNQGKNSSNSSSSKGSSKMKSVLEMLHERSKQKAAMEGNKGPTTTTTTTTTTTIIVSPPPNKPLVEGVKRKGTPRKRREDVIDLCVSDEDDDDDDFDEVMPKAKQGKRTSDASDITTTVTSSVAAKVPKSPVVPVSQAPVVMMVTQHHTSPGLRSLLPRNVVMSPGKVAKSSANAGGIMTSIPIVSALPVGVKPMSMASLPSGMTALPLTSLPPGSTFFTAVQTSPGATPMTAISSASLLNVTTPSKSTSRSPSSKSSKNLTMAAKLPQSSPVNSDALRALLVGKPYALAQMSPSSSSSSSSTVNTPMVFQMLTKSPMSTLVPLPTTQSMAMSNHKMNAKQLMPTTTSSSIFISNSTAMTSSSKSGSNKTTYSLIKPHSNHANLLNGVSCLTPPKTPDTDSASEVTVAASLSRPMAGQFDEHDVIPLCCCKILIPSFNKMLAGVTYCQALDSVDNKVLGCCNKVTNTQLVRPGVKIPFMAICEAHRKRLKLHQCCPGCGHFCSQGKFQQCKREGKISTHLFHKQCMFYRGAKYFCPHCGEETSQSEVDLKLEPDDNASLGGLIPSRVAKKDNDRKTVARMGHGKWKKSKSTSEPNSRLLTLPNKNVIDAGVLPAGPDQATLTRLCRCATEDRPKKYRTMSKDLYKPALDGDLEKVFYLLADGMNPNKRYEEFEDQTPLHAAATSGNVGTVFILEQFGAELHAQDKNLRTPMMCAAENGNLDVVDLFLKAGAKVEDRGEDGMTSLHYAAKAGYIDIIQLILETQKLHVNVQDDGGWTPIIWATESMLHEVVRYLISHGGDPHKKDNEENTGLHWAAFSGSIEIAEMFLDLGCELDTPNEHGDRPVHIAARQDHYSIIVLLLARGADVDVKNNKDESPMDCCLNKTGQVWMALKVNHQLRTFAARKLIQPERLIDRDITMGREKNPIACVNKEDHEPIPIDYLYINENVETSPLNINRVITSLQSCRCKDECSSMYCVCGRSSISCWYDKMGRLVENFNFLEPPQIFECNRACRCWVNCNNRVVQNGIICRLQLFQTNGRGWGVRTLMDIPKGTFVCEYIGELISDSEADRREDDSYLFDLDNKDGDTYCIDARKYGNIARFINHLCEPNLIPVKVFVEHQDLRFPRICFFSSRDIQAYEELGFDYGEKFWIIKWKHFTCACQSEKCKYSSETIQKTLDDYKLKYPDEPVVQS